MRCAELEWTRLTALLLVAQSVVAMVRPNMTSELDVMMAKFLEEREKRLASEAHFKATGRLDSSKSNYTDPNVPPRTSRRAKRSITDIDRQLILDLHNKLRSQVSPSAANMEYMTWDTELERSSESWASQCYWEHGPGYLLPTIGQNLGVHWGRYRPPTFHVQAWYDEVSDYRYPYPQECNPWCPFTCVGPVCTHYTQVVWATSNKVGCAINLCINMNVWGQVWEQGVYLVCNYSPKGNWWGHAPYKHGPPCSACPPSYGGGCRENQCYKEIKICGDLPWNNTIEGDNSGYPDLVAGCEAAPKTVQASVPQKYDGTSHYYPPSEPEQETNEVERQTTQTQETQSNARIRPDSTRTEHLDANEIINTQQMSQLVSCETKLRDRCKGTTCNRYECPAGCLYSEGKVIGTLHYDMQSSICQAAMHHGVLDNDGGWVDITRQGKKPFFIKSNRNGIQSFGKYRPANSFTVSEVPVQAANCQTRAHQICTFKKPVSHCPRMYCPPNCLEENPHLARVIGTRFYSDRSSICRAAVHAGVIRNYDGGYLDIMPVENKQRYFGTYQNGIFSESLKNPPGAKAFRIFAII